MYIYTYLCVYIYVCIYICVCIYVLIRRERQQVTCPWTSALHEKSMCWGIRGSQLPPSHVLQEYLVRKK